MIFFFGDSILKILVCNRKIKQNIVHIFYLNSNGNRIKHKVNQQIGNAQHKAPEQTYKKKTKLNNNRKKNLTRFRFEFSSMNTSAPVRDTNDKDNALL